MSTWFAIPTKKRADEVEPVLDHWRAKGYRIAVWRDPGDDFVKADIALCGLYPGYPAAVNALCREILKYYPDTEWIVTGGDDTYPDERPADDIAAECTEHFNGTFGVMQPTGDRWGEVGSANNIGSAYIDRVCGSPWLGADFCRRMYEGRGPLCESYQHMFVDEELQSVAVLLGVLWQRPDLTHYHDHWARGKSRSNMPVYLREANSQEHWSRFKAVFDNRKAAGFPGHHPLCQPA